ncbi:SDR family NAD(P)-dependent oxidoreductase [Streptomyces caniscabiei]|nr:SDR family NAD(P)-dependent oxidoreductase [Streptomyces caniscabiei]MDX3725999.1 SDR family NAD(P)-dependent oxidoreductase [Streptomyces caniscabiei]
MTPVLAADTFAGQSVLVTGGTSGIGAATADVLADLGAEVYALGLPPTDDAELPRHERVRVVQQDVTDRDALSRRITAYDRLDHLITCAGISADRDEYGLARWGQVLEVNLTSALVACQAARPLLARRGGSVVTVSSMFSFFGSRDRPAYSTSKGAVSQLTRSLAAEYSEDGIRGTRWHPASLPPRWPEGRSTTRKPHRRCWHESPSDDSADRRRSRQPSPSCAPPPPRTSRARSSRSTAAIWPFDLAAAARLFHKASIESAAPALPHPRRRQRPGPADAGSAGVG